MRRLMMGWALLASGSGCYHSYAGPFITDVWQGPDGKLVVQKCSVHYSALFLQVPTVATGQCTAEEIDAGEKPPVNVRRALKDNTAFDAPP